MIHNKLTLDDTTVGAIVIAEKLETCDQKEETLLSSLDGDQI